MGRIVSVVLLTILAAPACEVFLPARGGPGEPCLPQDRCRDGLVCVDGACSTLASECTGDDTPCTVDDPCTSSGTCQAGSCVPGEPDRDDDGDGFVAAGCGGLDCKDDNPKVNPDMPEAFSGSELCRDGLDNDCDGDTDNNDSGCQQQQRFCTADWCWYNRLPTGNGLTGAWSSGPKTWVVGGAGTIIDATSQPLQVASNVTVGLQGVGGCGLSTVWAVGLAGTALMFDGDAWFSQYRGSEDLFGAWCSGPDDAFIVGEAGTVLHWDGSSLEDAGAPAEKKLTAVSGGGPGDVWVVGLAGEILHYDGSQWQRSDPKITMVDLYGVWSSGEGAAWVVGDGGTVLQVDTECLAAGDCPGDKVGTASWRAVAGRPDGEVWIAGTMGEIWHFDGASWSPESPGPSVAFRGITVDGAGRVTAVGDYGTMVTRAAGEQSWRILTAGTRGNVYALQGHGNVLLAAADRGLLIFDGQVWLPVATAPEIVAGLAANDAGEFWAVGEKGSILHGSGDPLKWSTEDSGTTSRLNAAWAIGEEVWAVGADSTIIKRSPEGTWKGASTGVSGLVQFQDIWAGSSADAWAVGSDGNVYQWDGSKWNRRVQGVTDAPLWAVWSVGNHVWAVGGDSTILHIENGSPTIAQPLYPRQKLYDVWGRSESDVWAVGEHGVVLHWDGQDWTQVESGADTTLRAAWCGDGTPSCWLGGFDGTILGSTW